MPTCGLQPLLDIHFEKAHGAPVSWETFNRSKPQNDLETDKIGGIQKEASYLHSHFHIFASLPGLNGPAFVLPDDLLECRENTATGQHETLVKDLSRLRLHRLNQFDTIYLPPAQP